MSWNSLKYYKVQFELPYKEKIYPVVRETVRETVHDESFLGKTQNIVFNVFQLFLALVDPAIEMDDLNIFHVLGDAVSDIGHGVQLSTQIDIPSGTLVCFLDGQQRFHYGFCFKNGNNLRVVTWANGRKKMKTVPKGSYVIAFRHVTTVNNVRGNYVAADFQFQWFNGAAMLNVTQELKGLILKSDEIEEIVQGLCGLTIQEFAKVQEKIEELKNH